MTKLIWMSDPHFASEGDVLGHDPRERLKAAIDHINTHHSDAAMCVISGDLVNSGTLADYEGVRARLDALAIPYFPMVGNHDKRDLVRQTLPLPDGCMSEFIQFAVQTPSGMIVCLDTQKVGSGSGEFCEQRTAWLRETLAAANSSVFLFMHHPPIELGLPMQDTANMEGGQAFTDLVSGFECVKYMFMGHVHRPITGTFGRIPFATMRSILYQAPPPRPAWTWDNFCPSREAPCIGVVNFSASSVIVQYDQFCQYETGTALVSSQQIAE